MSMPWNCGGVFFTEKNIIKVFRKYKNLVMYLPPPANHIKKNHSLCATVAGKPLWQMLLLCCDRRWTVRASTASPTRCPETRRWWWSTAMTKTQTCSRYCFAKTKNTLKSLLFCPLLSINSVSACCLSLYSWGLISTRANQDLWYWTVLLTPPVMCSDIVLRMFLFGGGGGGGGGGLRMSERVIRIEANGKKSKNGNQQQPTGTKQKRSL